MKKRTISGIIKEFFEKNPNRDIEHDEVVDHVFEFFPKARDPWRSIRKLHEEGYLIKVRKGVYRREPGYKGAPSEETFPPKVKEAIFKRDKHRCVICGNGIHNGYEIHADHVIPRSKGGKSTVDNGITLCSEHNILKKNYGQTVFLKKYVKKMLKIARRIKDEKRIAFFEELLKVIEKHKID